jgi:hypothetical protein
LLSSFGAISALGAGGGSGPNGDIADAAQAFQEAADNAPDDIKADMQVFADAFAEFGAALEELDINLNDPASFASMNAEQQAQFFSALEAFDDPAVTEASENLEAFFAAECS